MKIIKSFDQQGPTLYLVATPIGNLKEFSMRAIEVLNSVFLIACEDTRVSRVLLEHYEIKKPLISYHNFNESEASQKLLAQLALGHDIALISDAGYPLISDPGYELVNEVLKAGYRVSCVSGANAALYALVCSGLTSKPYLFYGFLNAKKSLRLKELESLKHLACTMIFYESPKRITKTLADMAEVFGKRKVVIGRELSKKYEEFIHLELDEDFSKLSLKGELVVLVSGYVESVSQPSDYLSELKQLIKNGLSKKAACKEIAAKYHLKANALYQQLINAD